MMNYEFNSQILLSIIIPAYNVQDYILNTLRSIINQVTDEIEVIIVNDGSTDKTLDVINLFKKSYQDSNINVLSRSNGGVSKARNMGLSFARGKFVLFFDGDDIMYDNVLFKVIDLMKNSNYDFITAGYDYYSSNGKLIITYEEKFGYLANDVIEKESLLVRFLRDQWVYLHICSSIFKKRIIDEFSIRFTEGQKIGEDTEFVLKYLTYAKSVYQLREPFFKYIQRSSSATHQMKKTLDKDIFVVKKMYLEVKYLWEEQNLNPKVIKILNEVRLPLSISMRLLRLSYIHELTYPFFKKLYVDNDLKDILTCCRKKYYLPSQRIRYFQTYLMSLSVFIAFVLSLLYSKMRIFVSKEQ